MRLVFLSIILTFIIGTASSQCCIEGPVCTLLPFQTCMQEGDYYFQFETVDMFGNVTTIGTSGTIDEDGLAHLQAWLGSGYGTLNVILDGITYCSEDVHWSPCEFSVGFIDPPCEISDDANAGGTTVIHNYCVGDTTRFGFLATDATQNFPYPFSPDLLDISRGRVITYTDTSFVVVWEHPGTQTWQIFYDINGFPYAQEVDIVIKSIEDIEVFVEGIDSDTIVICENEEVYFQVIKEATENVLWSLSDGRTFDGLTQVISFEESGFFELTAALDTECNCSSDGKYFIEVRAGQSPKIDCVSSICVGSEADYFAQDDCDTYIWEVGPGGEIIDGGGPDDPYVRVKWLDGTGEISLSNPDCFTNECETKTTIQVPLIGNDLAILGEEVVCAGDIDSYLLDTQADLEMLWRVDSEYGAISVYTWNTNPTEITWKDQELYGSAIVSVTYENCFLECAGSAELEVFIKPNMHIVYDKDQVCLDTDFKFSNNIGARVQWILEGPTGVIETLNAETITVNLDTPGQYTLSANDISGTFCEAQKTISFQVNEPIAPPTEIDGLNIICVGEYASYSIPNLPSNLIPYWTIYDGSFVKDLGPSSTINVFWNSNGPYQIDVKFIDIFSDCESPIASFPLGVNLEIMGPENVCLGQQVKYSVDAEFTGSFEWDINPPEAAQIIWQESDSLVVLWTLDGIHQITASNCGYSINYQTEVHNYPTLEVNYDDVICSGGLEQLDIITESNNFIEVLDTSYNLIIQNDPTPSVDTGIYIIRVSNAIGCDQEEMISIIAAEDRQIVVSPRSLASCLPFSRSLYILNPTSALNYEWFFNGATTAQDSFFFVAMQHGTYRVVGTDQYGCQYYSEEISVFNSSCCDPIPGPPANAPDAVAMDANFIDCLNWEFDIIPPYLGTNWQWNFDDLGSANNTATGTSVSHEFSGIGYYIVRAVSDLPCISETIEPCGVSSTILYCETARQLVVVPLEARFEGYDICPGDTVFFENTTPLLPVATNVQYQWDFGDPTSAENASTNYSPYHKYENSGNYTVQLEVSDDSGCVSTFSQVVEVKTVADVNIVSRDTICVASDLDLSIANEIDYSSVLWNFGDPNSGAENISSLFQTNHAFTDTGDFTIEVIATNLNECFSLATKQIHVIANEINEQITALTDTLKCESDIITLIGPIGSYDYEWSTGETTDTINITEAGEYGVTITNGENCKAFVDPIFIVQEEIPEPCISAYISFDETYKDSLTICETTRFSLILENALGANITWSEGSFSGNQIYYSTLIGLGVGSHEITASVEYSDGNCAPKEASFILELVGIVPEVTIVPLLTNPCENDSSRLFVTPYDSGLTYTWHNGDTGESTVSIGTRNTSVTVTNGFCEDSDFHFLNRAPNPIAWFDGCMEVCFPKTFCFNGLFGDSYSLIKDGVVVDNINSGDDDFIITEPGNYWMEVGRLNCKIQTDTMFISAAPQSRNVEGIAFLDLNGNGMYDPDEPYLPDALIRLFNAGLEVAQTNTDSVGYYLFENIVYNEIELVIDTNLFPDYDTYFTDSLLNFTSCIDEKDLDIPFITPCFLQSVDTIYTCRNMPIDYNGEEYYANEEDVVWFKTDADCDSVVNLTVLEFVNSPIDFSLGSSCQTDTTGFIEIENASLFQAFYLDDSLVNLLDNRISGLAEGDYTLVTNSVNACPDTITFTIDGLDTAMVDIVTSASCAAQGNGSVNISTDIATQFFLNGVALNLQDGNINDLSAGNYTLSYATDEGCFDSLLFEIESYLLPVHNFATDSSCFSKQNGTLMLTTIDSLNYFLDGSPVDIIDNEIAGMAAGDYMLSYENINGCKDSFEFTIAEITPPNVQLEIEPSCTTIKQGSVTITSDQNLSYSLDRINYTNDTVFSNLRHGTFILYYTDESGCEYDTEFDIPGLVVPSFDYLFDESCVYPANGAITISNASNVNNYILNDIDVTLTNNQITGLAAGSHSLMATSEDGCTVTLFFSIDSIEAVQLGVVSSPSCYNEDNGSITINTTSNITNYMLDGQDVGLVNNQLTGLAAGLHSLITVSDEGCLDTLLFTIDSLDAIQLDIDSNPSCENESNGSVIINTNELLEYSLNGTMVTPINGELEGLPSGMHNLLYTNQQGCSDSILFVVDDFSLPDHMISTESSCEDLDNGVLFIDAVDSLEYQLDGQTINIINNEIPQLGPGSYTLSFSHNAIPCIDSLTFVIEGVEEPSLDFSIQGSCTSPENGSITIQSDEQLSYSLNGVDFISDTIIDQLDVGNYELHVLNASGCSYKYPFEIESTAGADYDIDAINSCSNLNSGEIQFSDYSGGTTFSINGQPYDPKLTYEDLSPGLYVIYILSSEGCLDSTKLNIEELESLEVNMEEYYSDCALDQMTISPEITQHAGQLNYLWSDGSTNSALTVDQTGTYQLTVSDVCEEYFLSVEVELADMMDDKLIYMPNVFSPNEDGLHDCYAVLPNENYEMINLKMDIYDRWGSLVYTTNELDGCWDGKHLEEDVVNGVYVILYSADFLFCDGIVSVSDVGDLTVVR